MSSRDYDSSNAIAIVGMDGRFPGASDVPTFWKNLRAGVESIAFDASEPPVVRNGQAYVKASAVIEGSEDFDAAFFGFNPREAETMDPQLRLFLECAWTTLESAGYDSKQYPGRIGVFAGCGASTYLTVNLMSNPDVMRSAGALSSLGAFNDRDSLATLVAYKFDLTGPAATVQTFCSTSLVAVHLGCQSLLNGESDLVLAGAATVNVTAKDGYQYTEGGILSPDGHCRAFDERAAGTIFGNGVGVVALKRLDDAFADGDVLHAVIRGSAINNDGEQKAGYTAPSIVGQSKAIAEALAVAELDPRSISYIEAHGTGTALGDPIEIEALTRAFRASTEDRAFCAIGSVKTNIGHLDRAAGIAALIKTVLALENREVPPSLHYQNPNPKIDFESSPFYVNGSLRPWETNGAPRIAGVSALGFGGTNAHVIVQEAPKASPSGPSRSTQLLVVSAKTQSALEKVSQRLAGHLRTHETEPLADVAYTLMLGRRRLPHRKAVVCNDAAEGADRLELQRPLSVSGVSRLTERPVVFMFPGQGAQYVNMTKGLYEEESVYRDAVDECSQRLEDSLGLDVRNVLFSDDVERASERLRQTAVTQPALFVVELALARLWMSWGVKPQAFIGHSVGEYVAAHLAGVLGLEDALALIAERGRLMQSLPAGAMLVVALPAEELLSSLPQDLSVASVNAPSLSVVSGPTEAVERFEAELRARDVFVNRLQTSHAFHSAMMDPILPEFERVVARATLNAPSLPFVSNVTGNWAEPEEVTQPSYWARHLREAVQFSRGVETLWAKPERILLEVGPGTTLRTLAKQHEVPGAETKPVAYSSVRAPKDPESDLATLSRTLGELWVAGAQIDFGRFYSREKRRRVSLPTYPFERERYWVEVNSDNRSARGSGVAGKSPDVARWFYLPSWRSALAPDAVPGSAKDAPGGSWLVFVDEEGLLDRVVRRLRTQDIDVVTVRQGERFAGNTREGFTLSPGASLDYRNLLKQIGKSNRKVGIIVHGWSLGAGGSEPPTVATFEHGQEVGYFSLMHLIRAIDDEKWHHAVRLGVLSSEAQEVLKGDPIRPERATVLGLAKVIPQEHQGVTSVSIDIDASVTGSWESDGTIEDLILEIDRAPAGSVVAYRRGQRFVQHFEPVSLAPPHDGPPEALREGGTYLITGGLGGVTFILAALLATSVRPRLVLTGRTPLPERDEWTRWLESRGEADPVSQRIRKVQKLEAWGAEVSVHAADAGDVSAMRQVVEDAESRFGRIDGVIHGAGIVGGNTFRPLVNLSADAVREQFHPKVAGLLALEQALHGRKLDFCMLTSSLSSVLGGFAYGAYAAANVFMDAYARYHNQRSETGWISVNWDEWGLGAQADEPASSGSSGLRAYAMAPAEGAEAFRRILTLKNASQVVVSSGELGYRIDQWVKLEALRATKDKGKEESSAARRHPRPNLQSAYLPPSTSTERKVAAIWEELLGIDKVGIRDNFFELGGNSLLAIQLVARIRSGLNAEISVASLFEGPTVRSLSLIITPPEATSSEPLKFEQSSDRGTRRREKRLKRAVVDAPREVSAEADADAHGVVEVGSSSSEDAAR